MLEAIDRFLEQPLMRELCTLCLTLLGLFIAFKLTSALTKRMRKGRLAQRMEPGALSFLASFLNVAVKLLLVVTAAGIVGVPTSSLVALLGSVGLAIGLAMQGSLSNFAGGMMVLIFKPFAQGDLIMEPGGELGTVKDINLLYTTIRTFDMRNIVLPNGNLANGRVVNYSAEPHIRADVEFTVAYGSDVEVVRLCLLRAAKDCPSVLTEPEPRALLVRMDESALAFTLRAYCDVNDYPNVPAALVALGKSELDKAGIEIPFPQMDVHIKG